MSLDNRIFGIAIISINFNIITCKRKSKWRVLRGFGRNSKKFQRLSLSPLYYLTEKLFQVLFKYREVHAYALEKRGFALSEFYIFFGLGTIHTAQKMKISIKGQIYRRNPSFFVNFYKIHRKTPALGSLLKVMGSMHATLLKKRPWTRVFFCNCWDVFSE